MEKNKKMQLLEQLEERTQKVYLGTEVDHETSEFRANHIREFFEKEIEDAEWKESPDSPLQITKHTRLKYLPDLDFLRAEKILIRMHINSHPPKTISDIAKMIGLTHGIRTWGLNDGIYDDDYYFDTFFEDDYRIACAEDVYDYLLGLNVQDYKAEEVTEAVSLGGGYYPDELTAYGCEEWFIKVIERVKRLLSRAECFERAIETKRLIYYLLRYPDIYVSVYEGLFGTGEDKE